MHEQVGSDGLVPEPMASACATEAALPLEDYRRLLALGGQPMCLRGINIQRPWAHLILQGAKTIEARRYALKGYLGENLWVIETKGGSERTRALWSGASRGVGLGGRRRQGRGGAATSPFVSRIVGVVRFDSSFRYTDLAQWRADEARHRIPEGSPFDWEGPTESPKSEMHGWRVASAWALAEPQAGPAEKGMIGCRAVTRMALAASRAVGEP